MASTDDSQADHWPESGTKIEAPSNGQVEGTEVSIDNQTNAAENIRSFMRNPEQEFTSVTHQKIQVFTPDGNEAVVTIAADGSNANGVDDVRDFTRSFADSIHSVSSSEQIVNSSAQQETHNPEACSEADAGVATAPVENEAVAPVAALDGIELVPASAGEGTQMEAGIAADGNIDIVVASADVDGNGVVEGEVAVEEKKADDGSQEVPTEAGTQVVEETAKVEEAVGAKKEETEEMLLPPEVDTVQVLPHWIPKPCAHVTSIGGLVTEEELTSVFGAYGQISSISFENERQEAAIVRYDFSAGDAEKLITKVRESLNNTKLGDRTLIVEPFRPDSLLFIGNLTPDIDDTLLHKMFEPHGKLERAFVLRNAEGRSKGYGFVEYSLKSQATSAKLAMGNINMDGRVLRVEWSDCRRVADMFSTVLFIDRLPRDCFHIEQSLRTLCCQYGKVRDCHLAIGINQQFRGFGFIDFYHSACADKAHLGLDGHELEGSSIRVSFANPSKSAQSYKLRFGTEAAQAALGLIGRGSFSDQTMQPLGPGMLMGASLRGHMGMPLLTSRFMGPARPGMLGMGIGMQFGRGTLDRGLVPPLLSGGAGMLGPGSVAAGMMGRSPLMLGNVAPRAGMAVSGNLLQVGGTRLPTAQGAVSITPAAIAQVATAQAKAREEEAKARAEAAKQGLVKSTPSEQHAMDQYQRYQQNYYQQVPASSDQQYKQSDSTYPYQQTYQQPAQQQTALQLQYQGWNQQQAGQQSQHTYSSQYYSQPAQNYMQQQQTTQYTQHDGYYQQPTQQVQATGVQQQYGYTQQYGQQYGQQYSQQTPQTYGQVYGQTAQSSGQQYQQMTQQQSQAPYTQQSYVEQYSQQQQPQEQGQTGATAAAATAAGALVQDPSQQQAYAAYYQQQAQQGVTQAGTATAAASTTASTQQSYEAQWAAYYANQAAYQQAGYGQQQAYSGATGSTSSYYEQASAVDVGQKRTADQMESASQAQQAAYNYAQVVPAASGYTQQGATGYTQQAATGYTQQAATGLTTYQQQPTTATTAYQQQPASTVSGYQQQQGTLSYQQPAAGTPGYLQPTTTDSSGYDQSTVPVADGYQQQPATATGTFQAGSQGQTAVAGMYDYSKRPRY